MGGSIAANVGCYRFIACFRGSLQRRNGAILKTARTEPIRNRLMLALAYDCALRREELCALETSDLDPRTGW
ncbi:tyrosine-type recombinase/integrase (plasmid) [Paracoccus marcusii]|uniref:tyrosine-type recombinase/integrase n=1 Tax=Paracoccus marcusii TaxID=59779 RepID=UPI002ED4477A|nr:tyrosine-type recombinase/integrase [Paracoccus marcusii]